MAVRGKVQQYKCRFVDDGIGPSQAYGNSSPLTVM
jgi:hypothetical protein